MRCFDHSFRLWRDNCDFFVLVMHQNFDFDVDHFIEHKLMQPKSLRTSFLETNSGSMTG